MADAASDATIARRRIVEGRLLDFCDGKRVSKEKSHEKATLTRQARFAEADVVMLPFCRHKPIDRGKARRYRDIRVSAADKTRGSGMCHETFHPGVDVPNRQQSCRRGRRFGQIAVEMNTCSTVAQGLAPVRPSLAVYTSTREGAGASLCPALPHAA